RADRRQAARGCARRRCGRGRQRHGERAADVPADPRLAAACRARIHHRVPRAGRRGLRFHVRLSGSDRCVNEEELRRAQERDALAMQASDEGYWDWIVASDDFYASPRMLEIYGLPPDTRFASRADFLQRYPFQGDDEQRWNEAAAAYLAGESSRVDL